MTDGQRVALGAALAALTVASLFVPEGWERPSSGWRSYRVILALGAAVVVAAWRWL